MVMGLLADQYIGSVLPRDGVAQYGLVAKGYQLAAAKFAPPITRAVGEQLLAGVLSRAADSASQRPFVFQVTKVALFGSMLGDSPLVSDVDLAVQVRPRFEGTEFDERKQQRIDLAEERGKRFRSMIESVVWPRIELTEFLKAGSRYVSIRSFIELEVSPRAKMVVVPLDLVSEVQGLVQGLR